jgi:hypothetical protein
VALPEPCEGISCFIVSSEDMMELQTIELFLQPPNILSICHHAGVTTVRFSHDVIDDKLRVATDVKPLNLELSDDAQAVDECLVFCHIVGHVEVQSNYVEEMISHRGDQYDASLGPVECERAIKKHALVLFGARW